MSAIDKLRLNGKLSGTQLPGTVAPSTALSTRCAADIEPEVVPWLWPGRIPLGRITLIAGRPGLGKSFVTLDLAARVSNGSGWPDGGNPLAGDVIIANAEDDASDTLVPRLTACGADLRRIHIVDGIRRTDASGKESTNSFTLADADELRQRLMDLPEARLLVIDPIGSFLGSGVDAHRDNECRAVLAPLASLARERRIAVVLVAHHRKGMSDHADDLVIGSRAFTGLARAVHHIDRDPDDHRRRLFMPGKCNLGPELDSLAFTLEGSPARIQWASDPVTTRADDVLGANGTGARGPQPKARNAALEWLQAFLSEHGPTAVRTVKRNGSDAGFSERTIERAAEVLSVDRRKTAFGSPWVWELPSRQAPPDTNNVARWGETWRDGENKPENASSVTWRDGDVTPSRQVKSVGEMGEQPDADEWEGGEI